MRLRRPAPFKAASWCLDAEAGGVPGNVGLLSDVRVVLDLHPFCQEPIVVQGTTGLIAAADANDNIAYTAPVVQPLYKYFVRSVWISRVAGGDNTVSALFYRSVMAANTLYIDAFTASGANRVMTLQSPFWMMPGDALGLLFGGAGAAATDFLMRVMADRLRCG